MKELILIVEDDILIRSYLFALLELKDFNVISAEDGLVGLKLAKELQPDLIICDINMPNLDGYEVLRYLRSDWRIAKTPFIFITSEIAPESRLYAQKLGANAYLNKPVNIEKLIEAITINLKRYKSDI